MCQPARHWRQVRRESRSLPPRGRPTGRRLGLAGRSLACLAAGTTKPADRLTRPSALRASLQIDACVAIRERYAGMLRSFLGFYRPLEDRLSALHGWAGRGVDLPGRRKAPWLTAARRRCPQAARNSSAPARPGSRRRASILCAWHSLISHESWRTEWKLPFPDRKPRRTLLT